MSKLILDIIHLCAWITQKRGTPLGCANEVEELDRFCSHAAQNNILPTQKERRNLANMLLPVATGGEGEASPAVVAYLKLLIDPAEVEKKIRNHNRLAPATEVAS